MSSGFGWRGRDFGEGRVGIEVADGQLWHMVWWMAVLGDDGLSEGGEEGLMEGRAEGKRGPWRDRRDWVRMEGGQCIGSGKIRWI